MVVGWNFTFGVDFADVFNDSDNSSILAPKMLSTNETLVLIAIFALICSIGVLGNLLVIAGIALDRKMRKSAMNYVLLNLAFADLLNLLICLPDIVLALVDEGWLLAEFLCPTFRFLEQTSLYCSVLLQIAVCGERFVAINYPLKVRLYCTLRRFMVITGIIWGAAALSATPHWLQSIELRNDRKHCRIDRLIRLVPQFKAIELVLFYVIPLVIIAGLYCQISVVLWASSGHLHEGTRGGSRKGELSESDRHRKNVVKMLIACVTVYFLCYTPVNVMFVMKSLLDKRNFQPPYSILLVANALAYSCSGVNPLLYTVFCQKFRFRFHQLVTCKKVVSRGAEFSTVIPQDGSGDSFAGEGPASSRPLYARLRRDSSTFATRSTISSFRKSRRHSLTLIDFEESPGHNRKVLDFEMQADNGGFNQIISPTCLYRLKPESHFRAARDT